MDMIERCARAIWSANHGLGWDWADRPDQLDCLAAAKAAIEAMREPTEDMIDARFNALGKGGKAEWEAMVDAALKEHEGAKG